MAIELIRDTTGTGMPDADSEALASTMEDSENAPLVENELSAVVQETSAGDTGAEGGGTALSWPQLSGIVVGATCMLCSGTLYAFGGYSDELKVSLGWSESQMELVGYMGDCGVYLCGPFTGSLQDMYGPRVACAISAFLVLLGYGSMSFAVATQSITSPVVHGFFLALAGAGSGLMYVSALSSNILLFPTNFRGKLVGFLVSLFGLSALVFTSVYKGLLGGQLPERLLAFMASACGLAALLGCTFLPQSLRAAGKMKWDSTECSESRGFLIQIGNIGAAFRKLFQSSTTYWMLVLVFTLLAGNGLMIINNLSSIAKSIDPINGGSIVASLVALMSACNCLGRLISGVVSDMLPWRRGVFFWIASSLFIAAGLTYILCAEWSSTMLYLLVIGVGLGYGTVWSILPTCVSEIFGASSFGQNWGCMLMAPAAGALLFNSIAGAVYDSHSGSSGVCEGFVCYKTSILIAVGSSIAAGIIAIPLVPRTFRGKAA